jgi:hypothetical protein
MTDRIPGVKEEDLASVIRKVASIPSSAVRDADRFAREVRALIENRAQNKWPNEGNSDFAGFVLVEYPREVAKRLRGTRVADLIGTTVPLLGRVFFLSRDASQGSFIELPSEPGELLDWLEDQRLGDCTLIFAYRSNKLLVCRKSGVSDDAQRDPIRDTPPSATVDELMRALEFFHKRIVLIPSLCPEGIWERGREHQYVPGKRPEKCIQGELRTVLNSWFRNVVRADLEDKTEIGRIDVRLLRAEGDQPLAYWAIIELKVVRSKRNAKGRKAASAVSVTANVAAIVKGIRQARAYRVNRQAEEGVLEIYDMRQDKSLDLFRKRKVVEALSERDPIPIYNIRPMFGGASDARDAGYD